MRRCAIVFLVVAAMSGVARAQEAPEPAPVYGLDLKTHASLPSGKVAGAGGTVDRRGHRFQLEHLDLLQPTLLRAGARIVERYRLKD